MCGLPVVLCSLTVEDDKLQQLLPNDMMGGVTYVEAVIYFISVYFFLLTLSSWSHTFFCVCFTHKYFENTHFCIEKTSGIVESF